MPAVDCGDEIGHMQKGRAVKPNVDKGRLHARQHPNHFAEIDVTDKAALQRALDLQFLHRAVFHHGHALLLR